MTVLASDLDPASPEYAANRAAMLTRLAEVEAEHARAVAGGGEKYTARHRARGKLPARERVELLLDADTPFLELSPLAAWGSDHAVGASLVTGIGVVEGVECLITANDPTVRGGASNPWTLRKALRANEIALANRLPVISLVESGGADLPSQKEIFIPGGGLFRDLTRLSAAGIPTLAVVFGNSTAGGAYVPGMSDHVIMVKEQAKVFLLSLIHMARRATTSRSAAPTCTPASRGSRTTSPWTRGTRCGRRGGSWRASTGVQRKPALLRTRCTTRRSCSASYRAT